MKRSRPRSSPARRKPPTGSAAKSPRPNAPPLSFESRYPHIAAWVRDGWIEMGRDDCSRSFVRALDIGGMVWEGERAYPTVDDALAALDAGIAAWKAGQGL